jgi:hypothetical protein
VVVTTVTIAFTVLAGNVVPGMIEAGSVTADREVTAPVLLTYDPETNVKIVFGNNIVSCDTKPEAVLGDRVTAGTTLPGIVVVYVWVTWLPRLEIGTAEPTPEAVNWLGIGSVAVFGFAAGSFE